jgi:hypothetical protein
MMTTKPFEASDLLQIDPQPWQRQPEFEFSQSYGEWLRDNSCCAYSIMRDDEVVGVGGAIEIWPGRAEIWLLLDKGAGAVMNGVHRIASRFIDSLPHHRVETGCEVGWPEAHRWLKMLGFEHERTARKYMPSGRDIDIYVRIR